MLFILLEFDLVLLGILGEELIMESLSTNLYCQIMCPHRLSLN